MIQLFSRKVFIITAIMAFILIAVIVGVSFLAKPVLHKKLSETLTNNLPKGFDLTYDSLAISFFPPGAYIFNSRITSANHNEEGFLDIYIKHLWIDGFSLREYLMNDMVSIKQLKADGVDIAGSGSLPSFEDGPYGVQATMLEIERIDISNGTLNYTSSVSDAGTNLIIPEWNIAVERFMGTNGNLNFELEMMKPSFKPGNGLHLLSAESILLSSSDSSMIMNSFSVKPLIKAPRLAQFVKEETDIVDMEVPLCRINNLDVQKWVNEKKVIAKGVLLEKPRIEIYKDKTLPPKKNPTGLPSEFVSKTKDWLLLDSLIIKSGYIRYYELIDKVKGPGHLTFENLNASIHGISNDSIRTSSIKASAKLMGAGLLTANIHFPFGFVRDTFSVKGSLGPLELDRLNAMTVHVASVEILRGTSDNMRFEFRGNKNFTSGTMHFQYDDLRLSFLERGKNKKGLLKIIVTMIGNLPIQSSNPKSNKFREGEIYFVREEPKSIFNYWWKSLFSGIKSSVVVPVFQDNKK